MPFSTRAEVARKGVIEDFWFIGLYKRLTAKV